MVSLNAWFLHMDRWLSWTMYKSCVARQSPMNTLLREVICTASASKGLEYVKLQKNHFTEYREWGIEIQWPFCNKSFTLFRIFGHRHLWNHRCIPYLCIRISACFFFGKYQTKGVWIMHGRDRTWESSSSVKYYYNDMKIEEKENGIKSSRTWI